MPLMGLGEFDIIARYFTRQARRRDVLLGIGDDAAVLEPPTDRKLVVAVDTLVEGVHFPATTPAADIGFRALAVNLSDFAAMGAEPSWMTLSLSLPQASEFWLSGFAAGLFELADQYAVELVGGDTVRGPSVITVQLGGWVESARWLTRSGAQPGDLLFVSGVPGEASAGLTSILQNLDGGDAGAHLRRRFLRPSARIELGRRLRLLASAAMDVSDGLLSDVSKLCSASGCGAVIEVDALPDSPEMHALFVDEDCLQHQLAGGDDYELIFTLPQQRMNALGSLTGPLRLTRIGVLTEETGVRCERRGRPVDVRGGYDHFAPKANPQ
jgi:thiamine-monophosphate kinase